MFARAATTSNERKEPNAPLHNDGSDRSKASRGWFIESAMTELAVTLVLRTRRRARAGSDRFVPQQSRVGGRGDVSD